MDEFDWSNIPLNRTDNGCRECGCQILIFTEKIARKINKDNAQAIVNCQNCGIQGVIIEGIWRYPECMDKAIISEVQSNFLIELRELMNKYNVSFHSWEEDGVFISTNDLEYDDEDFICVNIDDV